MPQRRKRQGRRYGKPYHQRIRLWRIGRVLKKTACHLTGSNVCIKAPDTVIIVVVLADLVGYIVARFPNRTMNVKRKRAVLFIVSISLFLLHQYMQKIAKVSFSVIDSYLDPLLFMPIVLPLIVWERRLIYKNPIYTLSLSHVFGCFVLISILCEIVLPLWNERMIADIWDVLFYAIGAVIYVVTVSPHPHKSIRSENL